MLRARWGEETAPSSTTKPPKKPDRHERMLHRSVTVGCIALQQLPSNRFTARYHSEAPLAANDRWGSGGNKNDIPLVNKAARKVSIGSSSDECSKLDFCQIEDTASNYNSRKSRSRISPRSKRNFFTAVSA